MPNPVIGELVAAADKAQGAMASATVVITGFAGRLQVAIEEAMANGATAEELAPLTAEVAELTANADALAAAIASHPDVPPVVPPVEEPPAQSRRR